MSAPPAPQHNQQYAPAPSPLYSGMYQNVPVTVTVTSDEKPMMLYPPQQPIYVPASAFNNAQPIFVPTNAPPQYAAALLYQQPTSTNNV
jgi:hypothetical protein